MGFNGIWHSPSLIGRRRPPASLPMRAAPCTTECHPITAGRRDRPARKVAQTGWTLSEMLALLAVAAVVLVAAGRMLFAAGWTALLGIVGVALLALVVVAVVAWWHDRGRR